MIPQYIPDSFNLAAIDIGSNAARLLIKSVTKQEDGTLQFQKQQYRCQRYSCPYHRFV